MKKNSAPLVRVITLITLIGWPAVSISQEEEFEWDKADSEVTRLTPGELQNVPQNIVAALSRWGVTVLQTYIDAVPHNVIHGEFRQKGKTDWAVLCSKAHISAIIVFWAGSDQDTSLFAEASDKDYLQGIGGSRIGFSRLIGTATRVDVALILELNGNVESLQVCQV